MIHVLAQTDRQAYVVRQYAGEQQFSQWDLLPWSTFASLPVQYPHVRSPGQMTSAPAVGQGLCLCLWMQPGMMMVLEDV